MTDGDRATLIALELLRRQVGGLPGEFVRVFADAKAVEAASTTPAAQTKMPKEFNVKVNGFDASAANNANKLAIQGWPKVIALVNGLLVYIQRLNMQQALGGRQNALGGGQQPKALPAHQEPKTPKTPAPKKPLDRGMKSILDRQIRTRLLALRRATGRNAGKAFNTATSAFMNPRMRARAKVEWNSKTMKTVRGGAKSAGGAVMAGIGALFTPFSLKLLAVLGPLALLAATLSSATSGFQLVTGATKVLAATLGPILLPFMFLLAAGITTVSDILWQELAPNLEDWYKFIIENAVPAMEVFVEGLKDMAKAVGWVTANVSRQGASSSAEQLGRGAVGDADALTDTLLGWLTDVRPSHLVNAIDPDPRRRTELRAMTDEERYANRPEMTAADRRAGAGDFGGGVGSASGPEFAAPPQQSLNEWMEQLVTGVGQGAAAVANSPEGRMSILQANMKDALREAQMSMGPRGQFQGLAQASRSAQLAALNQSPYEAKILMRWQESIGLLTKVVNNTAQQPKQLHNNRGD